MGIIYPNWFNYVIPDNNIVKPDCLDRIGLGSFFMPNSQKDMVGGPLRYGVVLGRRG